MGSLQSFYNLFYASCLILKLYLNLQKSQVVIILRPIICYENEKYKLLFTILKKSYKKYMHCTQNTYLIGKDAYSK